MRHIDTIGVRELQQHVSAALRRVARGETLAITARGRLVAVLSAPSDRLGAAGPGRVRGGAPRAAGRAGVTWCLDTSAFLKLITKEAESTAMRDWYSTHGPCWSSQLLPTEATRAGVRLGLGQQVIATALDTIASVTSRPG